MGTSHQDASTDRLRESLVLNHRSDGDGDDNVNVYGSINRNNGNDTHDGNYDNGNNGINNKDIIFRVYNCFPKTTITSTATGTLTTSPTGTMIELGRMNHNVFFILVLSFFYGMSNSLWNGTVYVAYIKLLGHGSNKPVGTIEAVFGLASLLFALPIGYLADKIGRSIVIRFGGILLLFTSILQIGILQYTSTSTTTDNYDNPIALWLMGGIMIFWGIGDGIVKGPCLALLADSTPSGTRSTYYTYQFVCWLTARSFGPLVSIVLFEKIGDTWDMYHLRIIMYVGLCIGGGNAFLMMLFDDTKALDEEEDEDMDDSDDDDDDDESDDNAFAERNGNTFSEEVDRSESMVDEEQQTESTDNNANAENTTITNTSSSSTAAAFRCHYEQQQLQQKVILKRRQEWIPYIVFISGLISSLGSGMTVKFFPLFFKDEVGMKPSQVQLIYVVVPLVMVIMGLLCTKLASSSYCQLGRVQTTAIYSLLGILSLLTMIYYKTYLDLHPYYLVPIYIMRTALMNASYPLQESILMDFVPKNQRARWKSLDSVASFGWCGSAAFGGWLADKYDYTSTFLCTAVFQSLALFIWCLLLPLVPRIEGHNSATTSTATTTCIAVTVSNKNNICDNNTINNTMNNNDITYVRRRK